MIRVLVVDDQILVRTGITALLDRAADLSVVGEAGDGAEALREVQRLDPDVVLMDLRMPILDGVTATSRLTAADPQRPAVVVLTTFDTDDLVLGALRAGAVGFLLKDTDPDDLRQAVRAAAAGGGALSPAVTRRVIAAAAGGTVADRSLLAGLTDREVEVLEQVGRGATNDEIGRTLHMSGATARTHVSRIMAKLSARDRAGLVVLAHRAGLIRP